MVDHAAAFFHDDGARRLHPGMTLNFGSRSRLLGQMG
jgi:hypothetical protein